MANYNTFVVVDCKTRKPILTTSSARKANSMLCTGVRVEVWNNNEIVRTIYNSNRQDDNPLKPYIEMEREYIREKQRKAEERNKRRKLKKGGGWNGGSKFATDTSDGKDIRSVYPSC